MHYKRVKTRRNPLSHRSIHSAGEGYDAAFKFELDEGGRECGDGGVELDCHAVDLAFALGAQVAHDVLLVGRQLHLYGSGEGGLAALFLRCSPSHNLQ